MFKRVSSTEERLLGERLRREATESRPAFSESLHQRIVCAVRRHAAETAAAGRATVVRRWGRGAAAALAAACLLCAAAVGWRLMQNALQESAVERTPPISAASIADLPSIDDWADRAVAGLDDLTVSVAFEPQAAHLKHDACLAADVFLDQLPLDVKLVSSP